MRNPLNGAKVSSGYGPRGDRMHWGIDQPAPVGSPVFAPEGGFLYAVVDGDHVSPFSGYGPAVIMLHGHSGFFHLLGHLGAGTLSWPRAHASITEAQFFSEPLTPRYAPRGDQPRLPGQRVTDLHEQWDVAPGAQMPIVKVAEGQLLGTVGAFVDDEGNFVKQVNRHGQVTWSGPHLHWEVRRKATDKESAIDPLIWLSGGMRSQGASPASDDDDGAMLLLLAAVVLLSD